MKIGLIDVDGHNFPNIALMKISAWHKSQGDDVEWYTPFDHYQIVYVAKVFSFTEDWSEPINADRVIYGGSGYQIKVEDGQEYWDDMVFDKTWFYNELQSHIEHIMPDYSIYPNIKNTAYGFLTRGCPRKCSFCHVSKKEGEKSYKVADLREFWNGQKNIVICDPNILACKDWKELLKQLIDSKSHVDFNQGLDIRMMNEEKAQMLSKIKMKEIHFAWDRYQDKDVILPKLKLFARYSKLVGKHNAIVYCLVNFDTTKEQDLERIYTLKELGYWAYIMIYDKENCDQFYKDLARWVNNRFVFAKCPRFEDYKKNY